MKVAIAGKGGAGKTTISGTIARALARAGQTVIAVDADVNPMLGISLGVGAERTEQLVAGRQALDEGEVEHQPTVQGMEETFGTAGPDGVWLLVCSRIDRTDPG